MSQTSFTELAAKKIGTKVPAVVFPTRQGDEWVQLSTEQLFAGKTVALFALPGAFTPTCSSTHLPRYNELASTFADNGVDEIICLSVNDTFVMNAWAADQEADNIRLVADGNGDFTEQMGLLVDKSELGFGKRSWRYSMLVKDGVIEQMWIEPDLPGDPFEVSDADTMLDHINPQAVKPQPIAIFTKPGCPFCQQAKQLLQQHNLAYDEIVLGRDASSVALRAVSGKTTVPQVFIGGEHIGGSEQLTEHLSSK